MRTLLTATLAAIAGLIPLSAAALVERQPIQEVELQELRASPSSFLNMHVRFRAVFIETPAIYDPLHTPYSPERYMNIAVWDDEGSLFDPQVRADPLVTLYFDKRHAAESGVEHLRKFQTVEVVGNIASTARGLPWVNITSIRPVEDAKAYDTKTIYHVEQGRALASEGAYELADARFASALESDIPLHALIAIGELRARNAMTAGRERDAVVYLRRCLVIADEGDATQEKAATSADRARLLYLLAKSLGEAASDASSDEGRRNDYNEAVDSARASLVIQPDNGDAYAVLGIALAGLGRYDEAKRECAQAIRLQPNNAEVRWYLGRILDSQGEYDQAIDALKKAIDLTPKDHRLHKAIAAAYHHRALTGAAGAPEDFSTAIREYDITLRLRADDIDAAYESGLVLMSAAERKVEIQIGEERGVATLDQAQARFQGALAIDAKHVPTLIALAQLYQAAGNTDAAIKVLGDLVAAEPDRFDAVLELTKLQVSKSDFDGALATLGGYRARHPNDANVLANQGRLALTVGKPEAGIEPLGTLVKAQPKNVSALMDLAECYLGVGKPKDALRYARLAAGYASEADAERAQALVAEAEVGATPPKRKPAAKPVAETPKPVVEAPKPAAAPKPLEAPKPAATPKPVEAPKPVFETTPSTPAAAAPAVPTDEQPATTPPKPVRRR